MKKIIVYILSISICFMPTLAFSSSNMGGWSLSNPIAQGASVVYQGAKKTLINGKEVIKTGTAKITPPVNSVAKVLARTAGAYALTVVIEEMLGAVDWILDPANNTIRYKDTSIGPTDPADPTLQYNYKSPYFQTNKLYPTIQSLCIGQGADMSSASGQTYTFTGLSPNGLNCYYRTESGTSELGTIRVANPAYDPSAQPERDRSIPLDAVAQRLLDKANTNDPFVSPVIVAAAADIVADSENDESKARPIVQQLEQSAVTPTDETSTGTGTQTGTATDPVTGEPVDTAKPFDFSMQFPVFCGWAPMVCESAQVVIDTPIFIEDYWKNTAKPTLVENWELVRDWATDEPDADAEQVEIEQPEEFDNSVFSKDRFSVSRQCPVPEQHTISLSGISVNFSFDLTPICTVLDLARPALVACSYLYAAYIVIGAARNG